MAVYSVRGFSAATAATSGHAIYGFWHPAGAHRVRILEMGCGRGAITNQRGPVVLRSSARGTPGSTVTPDADNAWNNQVVPPSGALLDLAAYTVQPTLASPPLQGHVVSIVTGSIGVMNVFIFPDGLTVPPGSGVVLQHLAAAVWGASECYVVWEEGSD